MNRYRVMIKNADGSIAYNYIVPAQSLQEAANWADDYFWTDEGQFFHIVKVRGIDGEATEGVPRLSSGDRREGRQGEGTGEGAQPRALQAAG
jgi:hypothetical protein